MSQIEVPARDLHAGTKFELDGITYTVVSVVTSPYNVTVETTHRVFDFATDETLTVHPRFVLYLDESMTDDGVYSPVLVTEYEAGYYPTDYRCGTDFKAAKAQVAASNRDRGLTDGDVLAITTSSFRAHFAEAR